MQTIFLGIRLKPRTKEKLHIMATLKGMSHGQFIESLVDEKVGELDPEGRKALEWIVDFDPNKPRTVTDSKVEYVTHPKKSGKVLTKS